MSWKLVEQYRRAPLPMLDKFVLLTICGAAHFETRKAYGKKVTRHALMLATSIGDERTLDRAIKRLERGGWLLVKRQRGRGRSNEYVIPIPDQTRQTADEKTLHAMRGISNKKPASGAGERPLKPRTPCSKTPHGMQGPLTSNTDIYTDRRNRSARDGALPIGDAIPDEFRK